MQHKLIFYDYPKTKTDDNDIQLPVNLLTFRDRNVNFPSNGHRQAIGKRLPLKLSAQQSHLPPPEEAQLHKMLLASLCAGAFARLRTTGHEN